jgi:hypothetical protein
VEQELTANAMLYGGNTVAHAVVNESNFTSYARRKYGASTAMDFADDAGTCVPLEGEGLARGRRRLEPLTPDMAVPCGSATNLASGGYRATKLPLDPQLAYSRAGETSAKPGDSRLLV